MSEKQQLLMIKGMGENNVLTVNIYIKSFKKYALISIYRNRVRYRCTNECTFAKSHYCFITDLSCRVAFDHMKVSPLRLKAVVGLFGRFSLVICAHLFFVSLDCAKNNNRCCPWPISAFLSFHLLLYACNIYDELPFISI